MAVFRSMLTVLVALFFSATPLLAGGSITLHDLDPILNQQPKLWYFYKNHFDISPNGGGLRLGHDWTELVGTRVAPFEFEAKMKGYPGPYNLKIIIQTDGWFYDADGKETSDSKSAVSMKQVLTSIAVGPLRPPNPN